MSDPGRQREAAVAADRDHAEALRLRRLVERIDVPDHIGLDGPDDLVLEAGERPRADEPFGLFEEPRDDGRASLVERAAKQVEHPRSGRAPRPMERRDLRVERSAVEHRRRLPIGSDLGEERLGHRDGHDESS